MFAKFCINWLKRRPLHNLAVPRYYFSHQTKQLQEALQKIKVDLDGKTTTIVDSGMIVGQHVD